MRCATGSRAEVAAGAAASADAAVAGGAALAVSLAPVAQEASATMAANTLAPAIIFVLDIGSPLVCGRRARRARLFSAREDMRRSDPSRPLFASRS